MPGLTRSESVVAAASAKAQMDAYQAALKAGMSEQDALKAAVTAGKVRDQRRRVRAAWAKTAQSEAGIRQLLRGLAVAAEARSNTIAADYGVVMQAFGRYVADRVSGVRKSIDCRGTKVALRATMAKIDTASGWEALSAYLMKSTLEYLVDELNPVIGKATGPLKDVLKEKLEGVMPKLKQKKYAEFAQGYGDAVKGELGKLRFGFFTHQVITPIKQIHAALASPDKLLTPAQESLALRLGQVGSKVSDRMLSGALGIPTASESKAGALRCYAGLIGKIEARNEELFQLSKASGPGARTEVRKGLLRHKAELNRRTLALGQHAALNLAEKMGYKGPGRSN